MKKKRVYSERAYIQQYVYRILYYILHCRIIVIISQPCRKPSGCAALVKRMHDHCSRAHFYLNVICTSLKGEKNARKPFTVARTTRSSLNSYTRFRYGSASYYFDIFFLQQYRPFTRNARIQDACADET